MTFKHIAYDHKSAHMNLEGISDFLLPAATIDAHHHLWDLSRVSYPWLEAKGVERFFGNPTAIQKNYLPQDLRADIGKLPISRSVHIQVGTALGHHLRETAWLQEMADATGLPGAIVAYAELESESLEPYLDQIQEFEVVRGVRQIVGRSPTEDARTGTERLLSNPAWSNGLKHLAERNLSFDLQLIPAQMERVYQVLKEQETLKVALCHCGSPWHLRDTDSSSREHEKKRWVRGLKQLSQLPNLSCKISGLGMFNQCWQPERAQEIVNTVLDIFGPQRCMHGSNFPVDKLYGSYQQLWRDYAEFSRQLSETERQQVFVDNAEQFYRLPAVEN